MNNYEVDVLVNGRPIRQFHHNGNTFVEGRKNSEFELRFTNNTWSRIEVVPSVDGLSVMDGQECGIHSDGYLVPAKQSIVIPGWRLNDNNVAKFVFQGKNRSYSSKSGHGVDNVGVIGFMVFGEMVKTYHVPYINLTPNPYPLPNPYPYPPTPPITIWNNDRTDSIFRSTSDTVKLSSSNTTSSNMASNFNVEQQSETHNLGVGFGDQTGHNVQMVEFTRANEYVPDQIMVVYYDDRRGLESRGIRVVNTRKKTVSGLPNAFPTYSQTGCAPPPGWKPKR